MTIWVDADACPKPIKEILYRVAGRREMSVVFVANQGLSLPPSKWLRSVQVPAGFDIADHYIVQHIEPGDIVVTADIPLAAEIVTAGASAINPRGTLYNEQTVRQALSMRNFFSELRESQPRLGGPAPFTQKDRQAFANTLDRILAASGNY